MRTSNKTLLILCAVTVVDMLGYGIIVPILPFYAETMGASAVELSFIIAAFPLAQLISFPLLGRLSDRFGRKRVIVAGLTISVASYFTFGFASTLLTLLVSRVGTGIGAGTFSVAQAFAADVTDEGRRTAAMGYIGASYGVGLMLGPAIASLTSMFGYSAAGLVAAVLSIFGALLAALYLPGPSRGKGEQSRQEPVGLQTWLQTYFVFPMSVVVAVYFITITAFEGVMSMLAFFLERTISLGAQGAGILWAWAGMITILSRLAIGGRLATRLGDKAIVLVGIGLLFSGVAALGAASDFRYAFSAIFPFAAGYGLAFPALSSLASKLADDRSKGSILGGYLFFGGLGRTLGPVVAGLAFERVSIYLPMLAAALCFILAATVALAVPTHVRTASLAELS
jgi:MFS transporter, DHA1 family, tetracycline resistance protein